MSLCDALEAGIRRSQADSERLMEAVLRRMLGVKKVVRGKTIHGAE